MTPLDNQPCGCIDSSGLYSSYTSTFNINKKTKTKGNVVAATLVESWVMGPLLDSSLPPLFDILMCLTTKTYNNDLIGWSVYGI